MGRNLYFHGALIISITLGIIAQICLKFGALKGEGQKINYLQPGILGGLLLYFVAALLYIYALKIIPLSVAFPCVSISYVVVALLAHWIWGEPFGVTQVFAFLLISTGIYLLTTT